MQSAKRESIAYCKEQLTKAGCVIENLPLKAVKVTFPDGTSRGFAGWRFNLVCYDAMSKLTEQAMAG